MNEEERIKALKDMIEKRIQNLKEKYKTFKVYTACGEIVADYCRIGSYESEYIHLYNSEKYVAMIKIFAIEKIDI